MSSIDEILEDVLEQIIPTNQEIKTVNDIVKKITNILEKRANELNIEYNRIEQQGSTGIKQTQLRNDFDIDLFIGLPFGLYEPKYKGLSKNKLKKESKKDFRELCNNWIFPSLILNELNSPRLLYAEHPYVTVDYLTSDIKIKVDIVLYFDLDLNYIKKNGPITAVDRSPWHARFVKNNLSQKQKNDVRLLKQFFKACHSYGDKSAVGKAGFIGYSSELLIYHHGTIIDVFKNFNSLNKIPLDYFKRSLKELEKITHFQNDYLIITDPIDMKRNVGSAISKNAYEYCNKKIRNFLKNPSKDYFEIKPIPEIDLSNVNDPLLSKIFIIELKNSEDAIHYTISRDKLYSLGESIKANGEVEFSHAERFGKIIFEVYFESKINEYNLAIYCDKPVISQKYLRKGPPLREEKHVEKFRIKNPNHFERGGFLWIESNRTHVNFLTFLTAHLKNKIPDNLEVVNISIAFESKTSSGKKAVHVLKNMVLPLYI